MASAELIRIDEAALLLGIEKRTLYNWVQSGRIPVVRLSPRAIRFDRAALDAWVKERTELAQSAL